MSESLAFKYFPWQDPRPSGVNAEFDPSQANTATQNARALLIGQITSSGTATPNVAVQAYSQTQVNGLCGLNSMLALKYAAYRLMDPFGEVWLGPLADASGGTAATGSISFTGPATAAGTLPLYLMGVSIPVAVNSGDTASTIATNTVAAIAASVGVACSAAADGTHAYQVDLTALHKGLALNDIDIRFAYRGAQNGEVIPPGVGYTITPFASGATNPTLTTLLSNLGVQLFDYIDLPYTDTTSLNALETFLSDSSGRWAAETMLYGHIFSAYRGTFSARTTFGTGATTSTPPSSASMTARRRRGWRRRTGARRMSSGCGSIRRRASRHRRSTCCRRRSPPRTCRGSATPCCSTG